MSLLGWVTDASHLTPHGFCLSWRPGLVSTYAATDIAIAVAYYSIPFGLLFYAYRRPDVGHRGLIALFGLFILACGTDHVMSAVTLWVPLYNAEAAIKVVTAVLSVMTAGLLWPALPAIIRAPAIRDLQAANSRLSEALAEQARSSEELRASQIELTAARDFLDLKVMERTVELEQSHAILLRDEARFRVVVEAAPSALVMIDGFGTIVMVNSQTEKTFGFTREEMIGQRIEMLLPERMRAHHPELRAGFWGESKRMMGVGRLVFGRRSDATEFEAEIGLSPIQTETGPMVISSIVDVSQRIRLESELRQAQRLEAMGIVTAGVAHDFNNLLQAMRGGLELLGEIVGDDEEGKQFLDLALNAATRGGVLTHRLLAFSRQQVLRPAATDLTALFAEIRPLILNLLANSMVTLSIEVEDAGLQSMVDPGELSSALFNLAINARDAMPGGGTLEIRAARRSNAGELAPQRGDYCVVSVVDEGCGMSEETLKRAFDPFFSTKGLFGTGLGLSMVQGFARQSGGEVQITSAIGKGSRIDIWLPLCGVRQVAPPEARAVAGAAAGARVLLADDAPDVLVTVGAFLRSAGYHVTRVASADQGLALLAAGERFDVLVTDFAMPNMNGADFVIEARETQAGLPALMITGFQASAAARDMANVAVLQKPFGRLDLLSRLEEILHADVGRMADPTSAG